MFERNCQNRTENISTRWHKNRDLYIFSPVSTTGWHHSSLSEFPFHTKMAVQKLLIKMKGEGGGVMGHNLFKTENGKGFTFVQILWKMGRGHMFTTILKITVSSLSVWLVTLYNGLYGCLRFNEFHIYLASVHSSIIHTYIHFVLQGYHCMVSHVLYSLYGITCLVLTVWYQMSCTHCMVSYVLYSLYGATCLVLTVWCHVLYSLYGVTCLVLTVWCPVFTISNVWCLIPCIQWYPIPCIHCAVPTCIQWYPIPCIHCAVPNVLYSLYGFRCLVFTVLCQILWSLSHACYSLDCQIWKRFVI